MPPKTKATLDDVFNLTSELKLDITDVKKEVKGLREDISAIKGNVIMNQKSISVLTGQLKRQILINNQFEQHSRLECIRIRNLKIDTSAASSNTYVKQQVYEQVLKPILKLAVDDPNDELKAVPPVDSLLKNAHILPKLKNSPDEPNPIILRLNLMDVRSTIFKYRKQFIQSIPGELKEKPRIFEDLTSMNSKVLSRLFLSENVSSAWSMQGNLYYTETKDKAISKKRFRVSDPFDWLTDQDLRQLKIQFPECSNEST